MKDEDVMTTGVDRVEIDVTIGVDPGAPDGDRVVIEMACCEMTIEMACERGDTQRQVAQLYALALRSSWETDWSRVNAAIMKRWPKGGSGRGGGLDRIKAAAWSGKWRGRPLFDEVTP